MQMKQTLPQCERLKSRTQIKQLFEEGKGGFVYPLRYIILERACSEEEQGGISVLFSAPKRHHKRAYRRNRLKRRMREAYRLNKAAWVQEVIERRQVIRLGLLYVASEELDYQTIEHAIQKIIRTIQARS